MRRILPLASIVLATACLAHPLTAPAPVTFHSSRSAQDATRGAVLVLMDAGFRVSQTDSAGFAVSASRTATHNGNQEFVSCQLPSESDAAANRQTTLTIAFRAVPAQDGSDISIKSKVTTTYPGYEGTTMAVPAGDTLCVSNRTMEQRLQSALR